jgi:hypothetical protein
MLRLYRSLLYLYPAAHRAQFGDEMIEVLRDLQTETASLSRIACVTLFLREFTGLLAGALHEHWRALGLSPSWLPFPTRRFTMHTEFRFPKATAILMTVILVGVVVAIEKGEAIVASLNSPYHFAFLPGVALFLLIFYGTGAIGWVILFALRRSGVHRLETSAEQK